MNEWESECEEKKKRERKNGGSLRFSSGAASERNSQLFPRFDSRLRCWEKNACSAFRHRRHLLSAFAFQCFSGPEPRGAHARGRHGSVWVRRGRKWGREVERGSKRAFQDGPLFFQPRRRRDREMPFCFSSLQLPSSLSRELLFFFSVSLPSARALRPPASKSRGQGAKEAKREKKKKKKKGRGGGRKEQGEEQKRRGSLKALRGGKRQKKSQSKGALCRSPKHRTTLLPRPVQPLGSPLGARAAKRRAWRASVSECDEFS